MPLIQTPIESAKATESKREGGHDLFICEHLHISHFNQSMNTYHTNQGLYTLYNLQSESESESESE